MKNLVDYLVTVSNANLVLNAGMHLLIVFSLIAIFLTKNAKMRKVVSEGTILVLFLSVTINAAAFGNPFHIITFGIMAVIAALVLIKGKNKMEVPGFGVRTIAALLIISAGLWYPELVKANILESILVSPVGIVPCPTMLTALGMMCLVYPGANKKQFAVTVFFGIVYGIIGSFKLGVYFDLSLLGAAVFGLFYIMTDVVSKRKANKVVENC